MTDSDNAREVPRSPVRFVLPVVIVLGVLLIVLTYLGIQKSRSDSLNLLRRQGAALIESVAISADNAIKANSFFDLLIQEKFSDLAGFLEGRPNFGFTEQELADFALGYGVDAILIYDDSLKLKTGGARGVFISIDYINNLIRPEVTALNRDSTQFNELITIAGEMPGDISMYYIEQTSDLKYTIVIVSDALFYSESKKNIGIGYLVQNIAREVGIEYILFQTNRGIIFSSRKIGPILKIEKDPFLSTALGSDSTLSRFYDFNGREILELVRPFSSAEYGDGLFRVGLSLDKYHDIVSGFDTQMIILSIVLFAAVVLTMMYLSGKQKRIYLDRTYRRMKSLSEKVFDSINSGLIAVNREGIIETANHQFVKSFGVTEEEFIGRRWEEMAFGPVVPFDEFIGSGELTSETKSEITINQDTRYFLVNIARLYDPDNKPAGAVAIIYDYTHIRELEQNAQRRERLSEMGDLAAGVAHEIRNPLNAISIAAQRLMSEFEPTENREEFLSFARQIKSEAGRLNEIVTRFLSMTRSRGHSGNRIDASAAIEDTIRFLRVEQENTGVEIDSDLEPGIKLNVSQDRLKQMVINLVRNGIEACSRENGRVSVTLKADADEVVLTVWDNGPGISPEIKDKVFNPYFSTKEKGTGLGLSIVHRIVEEFNGSVAIISPPDGGAEFRIKIPSK